MVDGLVDFDKYLRYEDGKLYWREKWTNATKVDKPVGSVASTGYKIFSLRGKQYQVHRVIYFMHTGENPERVDHKDGDRANDLISNLRGCTQQQNCANRTVVINSTGLKGVSKNGNGFMAQITVEYKKRYLGTRKTKEEAASLYNEAAIKYFGEFASLNKL